MGVTFTTAQYQEDPGFGTVLFLGADHSHSRPASCCEDAELYSGQCDHNEADEDACGCRKFDVHLSNANAALVLTRLGIEYDPAEIYGEMDPAGFLGMAMVANVGQDDSGDADVVDGNMIDCGHRPGYFEDVMDRLAALASEARRQDKLVAWS